MTETAQPTTKPDAPGMGHNSDPAKVAEQELAQKIKDEYQQVLSAHKNVVHRARKFGEMLWDAKRSRGHGDWLDWLRDNCALSKRTSQRYLDLGKPGNKRRLDDALAKMKQEEKDNLTLAEAIKLARGKEEEPNSNASDRYDTTKKTLIKKLMDLSVDQAEAAIVETTEELKTALAELKNPN